MLINAERLVAAATKALLYVLEMNRDAVIGIIAFVRLTPEALESARIPND